MSKIKFGLPKEHREVFNIKKFLKKRKLTKSAQTVGYQISTYNIPDIWKDTQGEDITIAVLDTGYFNHIDLQGSVVEGRNYSDANDTIDRDGHSSHCTGIITANNNDIGMVGVAPKVQVMMVKVLNDNGEGYLDDIANAIRWAVDQNAVKVDIISMSLGGPEGDPILHDAVKYAYNKNIPIICAAGNEGDIGRLDYPGFYQETISIGAVDERRDRTWWSQTGSRLDFMAPGASILSTTPGNTYSVMSGTSMSAPWVAGVVALMMAKHRKYGGNTPVHTIEDVKEHLRKTAIDLQQAGKDDKTGYGLIDAKEALEQIQKEEPIEEGDNLVNSEELKSKFNAWIQAYNELVQKKTSLEEELRQVNETISVSDEKAQKILDLIQ